MPSIGILNTMVNDYREEIMESEAGLVLSKKRKPRKGRKKFSPSKNRPRGNGAFKITRRDRL